MKQRLDPQGKIVKVEERSVGSVKGSVYWAYIKAWGAVWLPLTLIAAAFFERGVAVAQNYWLKVCHVFEGLQVAKAWGFDLSPLLLSCCCTLHESLSVLLPLHAA